MVTIVRKCLSWVMALYHLIPGLIPGLMPSYTILYHLIPSYHSVGTVVARILEVKVGKCVDLKLWIDVYFKKMSCVVGQVNRLQLPKIWAEPRNPHQKWATFLSYTCTWPTWKVLRFLIFLGVASFLWNIFLGSVDQPWSPGGRGHDRGLGQLSRAQQIRGAGGTSRGAQYVDRHGDQSRSLWSSAAEGTGGLVVTKIFRSIHSSWCLPSGND